METSSSPTTVANPGNGGQTVVLERKIVAPVDATPGAGTMLSVRVERVGGDGADTATDRLCLLAAAVDVPVQAATVGAEDYTP